MSHEPDLSDEPDEGHEYQNDADSGGADHKAHKNQNRYRDEVYSKRVPAGKRTYFFDVKTTRSGEDFFITITESKRLGDGRYEKHKIFLYKEDFGKFVAAIHDVVHFIKDECLPDFDFRGLPDVSPAVDTDSVEDPEDGAAG